MSFNKRGGVSQYNCETYGLREEKDIPGLSED